MIEAMERSTSLKAKLFRIVVMNRRIYASKTEGISILRSNELACIVFCADFLSNT